jgi:hypothetical protein
VGEIKFLFRESVTKIEIFQWILHLLLKIITSVFTDEDHVKKFCLSLFILNLAHPKTNMKDFSFYYERLMIDSADKSDSYLFIQNRNLFQRLLSF